MTREEYLALNRGWKNASFNIKGNPASKAYIQETKEANGFTSEGQALDFIVEGHKAGANGSAELSEKVSSLTAANAEQATQIANLQEALQGAKEIVEQAKAETESLKQQLEVVSTKPKTTGAALKDNEAVIAFNEEQMRNVFLVRQALTQQGVVIPDSANPADVLHAAAKGFLDIMTLVNGINQLKR